MTKKWSAGWGFIFVHYFIYVGFYGKYCSVFYYLPVYEPVAGCQSVLFHVTSTGLLWQWPSMKFLGLKLLILAKQITTFAPGFSYYLKLSDRLDLKMDSHLPLLLYEVFIFSLMYILPNLLASLELLELQVTGRLDAKPHLSSVHSRPHQGTAH